MNFVLSWRSLHSYKFVLKFWEVGWMKMEYILMKRRYKRYATHSNHPNGMRKGVSSDLCPSIKDSTIISRRFLALLPRRLPKYSNSIGHQKCKCHSSHRIKNLSQHPYSYCRFWETCLSTNGCFQNVKWSDSSVRQELERASSLICNQEFERSRG